jgi:hypothetical protein
LTLADAPIGGVDAPRWIAASLDVKEGRDPLGLQTTTQDRLMPRLLPGILELSRRARYFSFHTYLLDKYRRLREPADSKALAAFIKKREWEYGLAVMHCPRDCRSSPVGALRLRGVVGSQQPPFPRGESVESAFGGYGLYYRSPLAEIGIVARAGTLLGNTPIAVDVLYPTERAERLASTFADAVEDTEYVNRWMLTSAPIPLEVLVEYADVACLCQLRHRPEERDAVHAALFGEDDGPVATTVAEALLDDSSEEADDDGDARPTPGAAIVQRRRSVAHYLSLVDAEPAVVDDEGAYRERLWAPADLRSVEHETVAGQWAGLIAKDVWQDALCSVWSEFCRSGVSVSQARGGDGLGWDEVRTMARAMTAGPPVLDGERATSEVVDAITGGHVTLEDGAEPVNILPLEALRAATDRIDTATSGLIVILELHRRAAGRDDPGWILASNVRSAWQPSLATVFSGLTAHLTEQPTVADTLWWLVHRFIVGVHERIAYSKLPEHTFRFRWEDGRVRFFDNGIGRFPLAAIRNEPLSLLTHDLGLWERDSDDEAHLSPLGRAFIAEVFP